jgi:chemotaxis response regulator CheB
MGERRGAMVCDDDPLMVAVVSTVLRDAGFEVVAVATSAAELRDLLPRAVPDVLVLDQVLPDASGDHALALVAEAAPGCRVIVFTGSAPAGAGHDDRIFAWVEKRGTGALAAAVERAAGDLAATGDPRPGRG